MRRNTGLLDIEDNPIYEGDWVTLGDNLTADNSMGELPNGWFFSEEEDIYQVYYDGRCDTWGVNIPGIEPDSNYNKKYLNHAYGLLHEGCARIVPKPKDIS